ncbi:MAG TPA: OB-fold domain-containing protein [Dehalococcoidales bacterium]
MAEYTKQLPLVTTSDKPFWEAARRHELTAYKCANCGTYYSQVTDCVACYSPRMAWVKVSGKGQVFTFCIYRQLYHPAWKGDLPYNVAWIKLDEGPIVIGNIIGCKNEEIRIEMPVEVVFEDITPEVTLPKFRPTQL